MEMLLAVSALVFASGVTSRCPADPTGSQRVMHPGEAESRASKAHFRTVRETTWAAKAAGGWRSGRGKAIDASCPSRVLRETRLVS